MNIKPSSDLRILDFEYVKKLTELELQYFSKDDDI